MQSKLDYNIIFGIATALGIGTLIGIERERDQIGREEVAGLRTFILISLLGNIIAILVDFVSPIFMLSFLGLIALIAVSYFITSYVNKSVGLTTEITTFIIFLLGYMAYSSEMRAFAVMISIAVTIILAVKKHTMKFAEAIEEAELLDTLKFCIIAFIILPLLLNNTMTLGCHKPS